MEGDQQQPQVEVKSESLDERDHSILIILIGLVTIGVLMSIVMYENYHKPQSVVNVPEKTTEMEEKGTYSYDIRHTRDFEVLGLTNHQQLGKFFTVAKTGLTLYVSSENSCDNECLESWTPYKATKTITTGDLTTINGQYAYKGKLLYTFNSDTKKGSFLGDGASLGVWRIARP